MHTSLSTFIDNNTWSTEQFKTLDFVHWLFDINKMVDGKTLAALLLLLLLLLLLQLLSILSQSLIIPPSIPLYHAKAGALAYAQAIAAPC